MRLSDEIFANVCYAIDPKNTTAPSVKILAGQIVAIIAQCLSEQGPDGELAAKLANNCETPDVDLSWIFPIIAKAMTEHPFAASAKETAK